MKKLLTCSAILLSGCGPIALDFTVGWGANQKIEKNLKIDQKQTPEQTAAQTTVITDVIKVIPLVAIEEPTPKPPKVKQVRRKLTIVPKDDVCKCTLGSGQLCTYHNDHVTCELTNDIRNNL